MSKNQPYIRYHNFFVTLSMMNINIDFNNATTETRSQIQRIIIELDRSKNVFIKMMAMLFLGQIAITAAFIYIFL